MLYDLDRYLINAEKWAGQEEIGCAEPASTWTSKRGTLANVVDTRSLVVRTHQLMDITRQRSWQGTGIALPWIVVLTTMPVAQAAIGVAHIKMTMLAWQALEPMYRMPVPHLDGKLETGCALGTFRIATFLEQINTIGSAFHGCLRIVSFFLHHKILKTRELSYINLNVIFLSGNPYSKKLPPFSVIHEEISHVLLHYHWLKRVHFEWDSVGCGVHNYASRTECFRCKTPRAFGKKLYNRLSVSLFLHTKSLTTSSVLYTFYNMVSFV